MTTTTADTPRVDPAPGKGVLLYDGQCPLCINSIRILKALDWLGRVHYQDARDLENLPPSAVELSPKRMLEEMHVVTPDRRSALAGFRAFRWLAWRLPLGMAVAPFLYIPGVLWLGNRVYLLVARNRYNLIACVDGVCSLPPRKPARAEQSAHSD